MVLVLDRFHSFPTSELQVGHVLPTGVVLQTWQDRDEALGEVVIAMTAAGVGHAWPKGSMVEIILGRVSDDIVETLRAEFAEAYAETHDAGPDLHK